LRPRRVALAPGFSAILPTGWHLHQEQFTRCIDPWQLLAATSYGGAWKRPPPDGALVFVQTRMETRATPLAPSPRRIRFRERARQFPACCPPLRRKGWSFTFESGGYTFYAYVYLGGRASDSTRREAAAVLQSLRLEPSHRVRWTASRSRGTPSNGFLAGAVRFPEGGRDFFTWDPVLRRAPNRPWRRWGATKTVARALGVIRDVRLVRPDSPRIGIGDLSRPRGGDFGIRFGGIGHVSHQNGLDVDVYYPRLDRRERAPTTPAQVDRRLSQMLVDEFVRRGAKKVFVGPNVRLRGPGHIVQVLPNHDNHMHVRFANA
jgi:hypothetical protein